ncbi:hypothetical protein M9Y10_026341 [Tritrichomonas musculus]|uniref:BEACH domain-containing protein n=1 Tax=Tritrichomonas musculus TaxID=1915356 RepID=A0ABR2H7A6_9EUKA
MLKSLNALLTEVNAQPHHKRWIKYYKKSFSVNKEFSNSFPDLVKFAPIFNFKEIDSGLLKKCLLNIKSNPNLSLDIELAKLLKIDKTPIPDNIDELCIEASNLQYTKSNEKNISLIFDCITRNFICYSYQFNAIFTSGKLNMLNLPNFSNYFLQYRQHPRFLEDVLILYESLTKYLNVLCNQIFSQNNQNSQQKIELIEVLRLLIPITKAFVEEGKNHSILTFIINSFFSLFENNEPKKFPQILFKTVIGIFSSIIELMPITDVNESLLLCSLSSHILPTIPNFSLLDNGEMYQLGSLCLKVYSYPELTLPDESAKPQFDVIISYVLWIVFTFGEKRAISDDYEEPMNQTELQPIGVSEYFQKAQFIPIREPLITNQYLTESAEMLNKMIQHSKHKTMLIQMLIEAMDQNQPRMKIEQYQSLAAFVLFVVHNCSDVSLAAGFSNYWNVLISEALFPEKNENDDRNLRDAVLKIFMRCFISVPSSRLVILTAISDYFTKHRIDELRYFLPLFNNLLSLDQDIRFARELIKSPLMNLLLNESRQYLEIFDLIRHIMFLHSRSCFESRTIYKFCFDCVKIPLYRESMIRCLENALITCTKADDAQHVVSSLICEITSSIQSALKSDIELSKEFVLILSNSMKSFKPETITTLFIAYSFEILSQAVLVINNVDIFELVLSAFIELCQKNNQVYQYFLKKENQVYTYLSKFIKNMSFDKNETEILFKFAFLNDENQLIRNYHAISLILDWSKNKEIEASIYQRIYDICKNSSANIYELVKADIFSFILERINEVGFNDITLILFDIYSRIASVYLPNSAYFDTLKLICLPQTDQPGKFISLFNSFLEQLKNGPHYYCNSFFHFEKPSDGIFGPSNMHFGNKFSFVTMIRCECLDSKEPIPLLSMISDKKDLLEFTIVDSQVVMKRKSTYTGSNSDNNLNNSANSVTTTTFSMKLNRNKFKGNEKEVIIEFWIRIIIIVDTFQVTLCIDDSKETTKNQLIPFQSSIFTVTIGNGFIGDLSDTYFLNEINIEKINDNISNKNIICQYIPRNVVDNVIQNVSNNQVKFNGQTVLYVSTISDIIKNESAIMNLLPLFSRFSNCNECNRIGTSIRCKVCGSLEINEGFEFIDKLFCYIMNASNENAIFMINKHFFSILSSYIEQMNPCYFTARFFNLLLSCFQLIKNNELAQEMIDSIFQNYDLIVKYSKEQQLNYFSEILPKAYLIQKDVFHSYKHFNFLVFLAIAHFPEESEISKKLWKNILTILPNRSDYSSYTTLLAIPMFHHYNFSSEMIFNCFEEMIDNQNFFFLKALESMEFFIPFTYIFKFPQIKLQMQSFRIISKLRKKCETSDLIRAIYQIIEFYSPSENSIELLKFINSIFLDEKGDAIENPEYFPLIVTVSSFIENEKSFIIFESIMHSIYDFPVEAMKITTDVFNWTFWLIKYITQFYSEVNEETLSKFSLPFAKLIEGQILSLKIEYQEIFVQILTISNHFKINYREILKGILYYLFTQASVTLTLSGPDLLKDVFIFTFFNIKNEEERKIIEISSHPKESSLNRFCWFYEQLVFQYYFNVNIDNNVWIDQQFAEALVMKIDLFSDYNIDFYNVHFNGLLLVTYFLIILMRFKSEIAIDIINDKLIDELIRNEQEIAHKCSSIILRTRDCLLFESKENEDYLNKIKFDELEELTKVFIDKEDSFALQLFIFENSIFMKTKEINESMLKQQTNYISESNNFTSFVLNFDAKSINNNSDYFSVSTISYTNLMVIYADLLNRQDFYVTNSKYYRKQIADSFLKELYILTFDNSKIDIHYKALNNITRKGRRVLMSIDYNKLNCDVFNKSKTKKRSRLSAAAIYNSLKIDKSIVRHNKIDLSSTFQNITNSNTNNSESETSKPTANNNNNKHGNNNKSESAFYRDFVSLLTPRRLYNGELVVIGKTLTFDGTDSARSKHVEFNLDKIIFIMKRTYGRFKKAVEVFTDFNRSYYFIFSCSYNMNNNNSNNSKNKSKSHVKVDSQRHCFNTFISSKRVVNNNSLNIGSKFDFFKELAVTYGSIYQKKKKGNPKISEIISKLGITERWIKRKMSNYEYLYYLNILSGRSFNDISKYPVFPVILLSKPDLNAKSGQNVDEAFRKLGHPVGALQPEKLKKLLNSFNSIEDMKNHYLYSSMFSNPKIVANLLSNVEPFASIHREMENRKSINIILPKLPNKNECLNDGSVPENDDFELTPEFFTFPAVFRERESGISIQLQQNESKNNLQGNKNEIESQNKQDENEPQIQSTQNEALEEKETVSLPKLEAVPSLDEKEKEIASIPKLEAVPSLDEKEKVTVSVPKLEPVPSFDDKESPVVELPKWASSPEEFINVNCRALESDTVTSSLNRWIDLIFGCNRCSPSNVNVYHPLLYPENFNENLTQAENDQQANEFGLYPYQLFTENHPGRQPSNLSSFEQIIASQQGLIIKHQSKKPALRIRKNFLITEDMQVTKFTFTVQAKSKQQQGGFEQQKNKGQNKVKSRIELKKTSSQASINLSSSSFNAKSDDDQPSSPSSNVIEKKRNQLQEPDASEELYRTTSYTIPEVPENFKGDIVEVSRSLLLVVFGSVGDSFISICDLRKCKTSSDQNHGNNNNDSNDSNNSGIGPSTGNNKHRSFSDLEDRKIGSTLSALTADDIVFNSLNYADNKSKKIIKNDDINEASPLLAPPDYNAAGITSNNSSSGNFELGIKVRIGSAGVSCNKGRIIVTKIGQNNSIKIVRFENAAIQCAAVVGGCILTIGLSDGTIRVFQLPNANLIHSSSYHNRPIVSISANREIGLLVSIDSQMCLIFELLYEPGFIRVLNLEKVISKKLSVETVLTTPPFLLIFKSGTVCALVNQNECNSSFVCFFNQLGDMRSILEIDGLVKEYDKYYDFDSREILILAVEPRNIIIIDVANAEILSMSSGSFGQLKFCSVKYLRAIMYSNGRITQTFPFSLTQKQNL